MEFNDRLLGGKAGQDILINFLESHLGYKVEVGARNNSVLNLMKNSWNDGKRLSRSLRQALAINGYTSYDYGVQ